MRLLFQCVRKYSSKARAKRSVLLQDTANIPVHSYPTSKKSDRRLYVWGLSETGSLGIHTNLKKQSSAHTAFVQHPTRLNFAEKHHVVDVSCGYGFTLFAVNEENDFSLFGTGINTDAQIGFQKLGGDTHSPMELVTYPAPIVLPKLKKDEKIQIKKCAAGRAHSIALSDTGTAFMLGNNSYGQCGRPVVDEENYFLNAIINRIEFVGNNEKIQDVYCGQDHSLFLTDTGRVYSCGWGADGQTGLGHYNSTSTPTLVQGDIATEKIIKVASSVDCVLALNENGEVFGFGNSEYKQLTPDGENQQINSPQRLESVKGLGKIVDIASGGSYCMILNENGDVFVWGFGLLGFGPNTEFLSLPKLLPATLFGRNEFNPNSRVVQIYSGVSHMGALTDDENLYMWGRNKFGCLGLGHKKDQYFPIKASVGAKVIKISCGVDHTIALSRAFA